ncbi:MAG: hypothetical protein EA422_07850 [Gemmatimonadales bacterium]|nr:MAG: hypothetical protein EA422_07850 [Gemmatimonadales bacterium]
MTVQTFLRLLVVLGVLGSASAAAAQSPVPGGVEGRITEVEGPPLRGVTVEVIAEGEEDPARTVGTDENGFFRADGLEPGPYRLRISRIGFQAVDVSVEIPEGERVRQDVELEAAVLLVEGIAVEGERSRRRVRFEEGAGITIRELTMDQIRGLPGFAEADPLRALEILPGVVSPTDFSGSYNVRGGSADQNLILLDGFPLYNPFHLGGVFSVFNADLVDRIELESGGFPAEFGGRVSSVLRVETDPGSGEFQVDGGISVLAARVALAGSLGEGVENALGLQTTRWRVSGRRSYVDQVVRPVTELPYSIRDVQGILDSWTPGGGRLTFTGYTGRDVLDLSRIETEDFPLRIFWSWGNDMVGARFRRPFEGGGGTELRSGVTRFDSRLAFTDFDDSEFGSEIQQWVLHGSLDRYLTGGWRLKTGADVDHFRFDNFAESGGTTFGGGTGDGTSVGLFGQAEWRNPGRWTVQAGLRLDGWFPDEGPRLAVPAPRLAVRRFVANGEGALKASVGRYSQFAHSLRDEELPLGIDVWVIASDMVPHIVSDQIQVGVERFVGDTWIFSADAFYRDFSGVIAANAASDPNDPGDDIVQGDGRGYGADMFVERIEGSLTGSLSVSWLKADRTFPDFISGREDRPAITYAPLHDRRLDLDMVLSFPLPREWTGGLRWHVGTGLPYTRPLTQYAFFEPRQTRDGRYRWQGSSGGFSNGDDGDDLARAVFLGPRNSARYPAYHRLDLSFRRTFRPSWGSLTPYLDILNVYNQPNVLFYFYDFAGDPPTRSGLSMFPVLPTIGVEVSF